MDGTARKSGAALRGWQAVTMLQWMFPQPTSYGTFLGFYLRKVRLGNEIAEFDLRLRMTRGRAATLAEMCCAGSILIISRSGSFPTLSLPIDDDLIINARSFDVIAAWVDERMAAAAEAGRPDPTSSNEISPRRSQ